MALTVVVAGVGPGLGESLARKFAREGCRVALLARSADYLDSLAADLEEGPGDGLAVPTDLAEPDAIREAFVAIHEAFGEVDVLVNHASAAPWKGAHEITAAELDGAYAVGVRGALLCAQEVIPDMLDGDGGTIIFTGATSAVRGREGAVGFSATKFATRGMAESMAREFGPEGIHVAHVIVDGQIRTPDAPERYPDRDADSFLDPDEIAESYWHLIEQDRTAWTLELDLRPYVEEF